MGVAHQGGREGIVGGDVRFQRLDPALLRPLTVELPLVDHRAGAPTGVEAVSAGFSELVPGRRVLGQNHPHAEEKCGDWPELDQSVRAGRLPLDRDDLHFLDAARRLEIDEVSGGVADECLAEG